MQGVQILNEFIHEGAVVEPWVGIGLSCCIVEVVCACIVSFITKIPKKILSYILVIMFFAFGFGMGVSIFAPRELIPRYQVIVEDDVNFNEFLDKYKIIDQNGLVYTVEERE